MGIILLFYYIGILVILGLTIIQIVIFRKEIKISKTLIYSILTSFLFLSTTYYIYANSEVVYAFGPFFLIPIITIIIPFCLGTILNIIKNKKLQIIMHSLLISIILSCIIMVVFNKYLDVVERFNLQIYY